jgi:hypothetical protein
VRTVYLIDFVAAVIEADRGNYALYARIVKLVFSQGMMEPPVFLKLLEL